MSLVLRGPRLPVDEALESMREMLRQQSIAVISAAPGAGKTTRVPPALLAMVSGKVLVVEPRRLAARLSAERVATELGCQVGEEVGYQMRFDNNICEATRLIYITEGVFNRYLQADPLLSSVHAVVIDEFHERHLQTDLALAYCRFLQRKRPEFYLVVMSATLDISRLSSHLGCIPLEIKGREFAVETIYRPEPAGLAILDHLGNVIDEALQHKDYPGDILVFLTGMAEIRSYQRVLQCRFPLCRVLALSAEVSKQEQQEVFAETKQRKLILSTNVAETSVTLASVTIVLDLGRAKIASLAPWSGLTTIDRRRVSQASAIQRMGRAGRTAPGLCYRLYSRQDFDSRDRFLAPEISRMDITDLLLQIASLTEACSESSHENLALDFLDPPQGVHCDQAKYVLKLIGAFSANGMITAQGLRMAALPVHPRLAALIVHGQDRGMAALSIWAAALLSEGRFLKWREPDEKCSCDIVYHLKILTEWRTKSLDPRDLFGFDSQKAKRVEHLVRAIARTLAIPIPTCQQAIKEACHPAWPQVLISCFADRLAVSRTQPKANRRRSSSRQLVNLCQGRGGILMEHSVADRAEFMLVLMATESQDRRNQAMATEVSMATAIDRQALLSARTINRRETQAFCWDDKNQAVAKQVTVSYDQIQVGATLIDLACSDSLSEQDLKACHEIFVSYLKANIPALFEDQEALAIYHYKIDLLDQNQIDHDLPRFEGDMFDLFVESMADDQLSLASIRQHSLRHWILAQLDQGQRDFFQRYFPDTWRLPNQRLLTISYTRNGPPSIAARIQDFFAVTQHPTIANGRIALVCDLLAPNGRSAQRTSHLPSFWQSSYPQVRRELAARYPKHHWPEKPHA